MLDAAVRLSLQAASQKDGAGPSSGHLSELSPAVRRRAVAAERRLVARHAKAFECSDMEALDDSSDSSFEESLFSQVTSRHKKSVAASVNDAKNMSYADYAAAQKSKRKTVLSARRAVKKEERMLRQQLCRKLTHVGRLILLIQL